MKKLFVLLLFLATTLSLQGCIVPPFRPFVGYGVGYNNGYQPYRNYGWGGGGGYPGWGRGYGGGGYGGGYGHRGWGGDHDSGHHGWGGGGGHGHH